jgi:signal transduction histidine kinase
MPYGDDDIKRDITRQRTRRDKAPPREFTEAQRLRRLENDLFRLMRETDDRDYFAKEVEKLIAHCGLRMERTQMENALRLFDQIQKQKKTSR